MTKHKGQSRLGAPDNFKTIQYPSTGTATSSASGFKREGTSRTYDQPPPRAVNAQGDDVSDLVEPALVVAARKVGLRQYSKIDLSIAFKSKESDSLEFNTLQPAQQQAKFVYQHWIDRESDLVTQEDPGKDPLLTQRLRDVPRYIELYWEPVHTLEQTTENEISKDQETEKTKDAAFGVPRGVGNASNSVTQKPIDNSLKNLNLSSNGITKGKLVDVHEIEKGFDSVSNKHEFVNSIAVVLFVDDTSLRNLRPTDIANTSAERGIGNVVPPAIGTSQNTAGER